MLQPGRVAWKHPKGPIHKRKAKQILELPCGDSNCTLAVAFARKRAFMCGERACGRGSWERAWMGQQPYWLPPYPRLLPQPEPTRRQCVELVVMPMMPTSSRGVVASGAIHRCSGRSHPWNVLADRGRRLGCQRRIVASMEEPTACDTGPSDRLRCSSLSRARGPPRKRCG